MSEEKDLSTKDGINVAIGDISGLEIFNNQILAVVHIRPSKSKGGIIFTDKTRGEDEYQSKIGLIVKKGPEAFVDATGTWFNGVNLDIGDWIIFRPSDGWNITVNGVLCRIMEDTVIRGKVSDPNVIY